MNAKNRKQKQSWTCNAYVCIIVLRNQYEVMNYSSFVSIIFCFFVLFYKSVISKIESIP